jgi:ATP-dependent RNA helicase DeaD
VFFEKIRTTLEAKQFKPHDRMIDRLLDQGYASTDICSALIHLLQSGAAGAPPAPAKVKPPVDTDRPASRPPAGARAEPDEGRAERPEKAAWSPASPPRAKTRAPESGAEPAPGKAKFERPARTGREPGKVTLFLNVGRKQLVTTADIVGKIAGVTRLPADVVGAIDLHQRHTLVDVAEAEAETIVRKLQGIRIKGVSLEPALAGTETKT